MKTPPAIHALHIYTVHCITKPHIRHGLFYTGFSLMLVDAVFSVWFRGSFPHLETIVDELGKFDWESSAERYTQSLLGLNSEPARQIKGIASAVPFFLVQAARFIREQTSN